MYNIHCTVFKVQRGVYTHDALYYATLTEIYVPVLPERPLHVDWYRKGITNNIETTLWNLENNYSRSPRSRGYVLVRTHTERNTYLRVIGACAQIKTMTNQDRDQPYDNIIMEMTEEDAIDHDIIFMLGEFGQAIDHAQKTLECFDYNEENSDMIRLQLLRANLKLHAKGILAKDFPILKLATHDSCSVIRKHALTCEGIMLQHSTQSLNLHMINTEDPHKRREISELEAQPRVKAALIQKTFELSRLFLTQDEKWTKEEQQENQDCHDDYEYDDHDEEEEDAGESDYDDTEAEDEDEEEEDAGERDYEATEKSNKDREYHHYVECDYDGCNYCEYGYINEEFEQIKTGSFVSHDDDYDDCCDDH